jgi:hypothetical protein
MKTRILYLILLGTIVSLGSYAQQVLINSTRNFWVNKTNGVTLDLATPYTWSDSGAVASITPNDSTASVTFGGTAGTAKISVYATSNSSCDGDIRSIYLQVVTSLTYGATFASASQIVCPANNHGATGDAATVRINFTGGNVSTFTYTLDGASYTQPVSPAAAFYNLDVTTAYTIAQSGSAHPIRITSVETSLIATGSEPTHTINVSTAPAISNIQF